MKDNYVIRTIKQKMRNVINIKVLMTSQIRTRSRISEPVADCDQTEGENRKL